MKYKDKSFTVGVGATEEFRSNWERTFRGGDPVQAPANHMMYFNCRECKTLVTINTPAVIAAKGSLFIRADVGYSNALSCPVCRNLFTSDERTA